MADKQKQPTEEEISDQMLIDPYADIPSPLEGKKQIGNSPFQFRTILLNGKLIMNMGGIELNEGDLQVLKNIRYQGLGLRSITGMTKINTYIIYNSTSIYGMGMKYGNGHKYGTVI